MSVYPIAVQKQSGRAPSSSGGKDYHLIQISTADRRSMVIFRYGKAGQWGNGWECKTYSKISEAHAVYRKKYNDKLAGAYRDHFVNRTTRVKNLAELNKELGPQYVEAIGKSNMEWLDPSGDFSKLKAGRDDTEWEQVEDGKWRQKEKPRRINEQMLEEAKQAEEVAAENFYSSNPNFGAWG